MTVNNNQNTPFLLVELLESFSTKEINGLCQIINCAYFNKDKQVIKLLDVLIKKVIGKNKSNIEIQGILFKQVFNKTFKNTVLAKKEKSLLSAKMSVLTKLSKRFLTIEALENSDLNKADLVLNALLKKKQFRLFEKQLKEEYKVSCKSIDYEYYDHLAKVEEIKLHYLYQNGKWEKKDNLNELMEHIDIRYLLHKLILTTTALSFSKTKPSKEYNLSILKLVESEYFRHYQDLKIPSIKIRIAVVNLMLEISLDAYKQLLKLLNKYEPKLHDKELRSFYNVAINFCTNQINEGNFDYYRHYVSVYKKLDEKGLIAVENSMGANELNNIVMAGCRINEFDWVNGIIEKYVLFVQQTNRKNVENFCLGFVAFHKKKYKQCIDYMGKVENFSLYFDVTKRVILIKSYFELDQRYIYAVAQIFRSFEAFIHNHKIINKRAKIKNKNFIRVALNLYRLKHKIGIIKIETLKTIIEKATYISNKGWLLEKIEELEGAK